MLYKRTNRLFQPLIAVPMFPIILQYTGVRLKFPGISSNFLVRTMLTVLNFVVDNFDNFLQFLTSRLFGVTEYEKCLETGKNANPL